MGLCRPQTALRATPKPSSPASAPVFRLPGGGQRLSSLEDSAKSRLEFQPRMGPRRCQCWPLYAGDGVWAWQILSSACRRSSGAAANPTNWLACGLSLTRSAPTRSCGKACKPWEGLKRTWTATRRAILTRSLWHIRSGAKSRSRATDLPSDGASPAPATNRTGGRGRDRSLLTGASESGDCQL